MHWHAAPPPPSAQTAFVPHDGKQAASGVQDRPLPENPKSHLHTRLPAVSMHVAFASQPPLPTEHSLMLVHTVKPLPLYPVGQGEQLYVPGPVLVHLDSGAHGLAAQAFCPPSACRT